MPATVRGYLEHIAQHQLILFISQIALLVLLAFNILSVFFSAPIIIALAAVWGAFDYLKKSQERLRGQLKELEGLIDDFGTVCFQVRDQREDSRVIKILDSLKIEPPINTAAEELRNAQTVFQLWHGTLGHKAGVVSRRAGDLTQWDRIVVVNEFIDFYNNYVDKIAERVLNIANVSEPVDEEKVRGIYNVYVANLAELRGRVNVFLKKYRSEHDISAIEVKALRTALVQKLRYA